jgi:zinc finger SWIM domain-containing protein 3
MDVLRMQHSGFDKVGCTTRDIYNFCHLYKQETIAAGDAQTVIHHMTARQERDLGFFFKYLVDEDDHLKGLFWSDSLSRRDYEAFGDVVVFDSTYRTNKYNLPFVPFVGLNHHRNTVIFGCGIISHETTEAYEWMLMTFTTAMSQKHPISVITDGDLAMQRAIRAGSVTPSKPINFSQWKTRCYTNIPQQEDGYVLLRTLLLAYTRFLKHKYKLQPFLRGVHTQIYVGMGWG